MALTKNQLYHYNSYQELLKDRSIHEALAYIKERKFSNKNLGISYRELNHWSTKGLLFESNEMGKWRKFNIVEMVWIELLKELRLYKFPLETIKNIKDSLETHLDVKEVITHKDIVNDLMKLGLTEDEFDFFLKNKQELIDQIEFKEVGPQSLFEVIILEAYFLKSQYRIIMNHNGDVTFFNTLLTEVKLNNEFFDYYFEKSNISISINTLISTLFEDYTKEDLKFKWKLISEEEEKMLDLIQSEKKIKSINIRFNDNSKIDLIEYTEELKVSPNDYLKKIIVSGGYQEIRVITQKGDIVLCERKVKQKI